MYVLITGASRGIGKSIAEGLLEEGAAVIGTARASAFPKSFTENKQFEGLHIDLSNLVELNEKMKPFFEGEKVPSVVINNAAVFEDADFGSSDSTWFENWQKTIRVNLNAPALISKWAINSWVKRKSGGIIINIASRAAYRGDTQEYAAYAASKGGLVAFTKSIARDFGTEDIVAYSIAPGFIKTDMAKDSIDVYGEEYLTEGMAFDEITSPEQVAEIVKFLASGKVKHMTGATIHINGGSYMI